MEDWKWVKGYEGFYKVSRDGKVISVERLDRFNRRVGRVLKPQKCGYERGYLFVNLSKNGKHKQHFIHRLVAEAFIPNPDNKRCVDHIDNDKSNNNVENLRWVTHKENMNNVITRKKMLDESYKYASQVGSDNPFSRKVAMYDMDHNLIKIYESAGQIEKELGIRSASILRVCAGKRKQTHNFIFEYVGEPKRRIIHKSVPCKFRKPIIQLDLNGNMVAEYGSATEAANATGFFPENISRAAKGLFKTYKGYKWRYK